jgi:hypothetical protein
VVKNHKVNFEGGHKDEDRDNDEAHYSGAPVCELVTLDDGVDTPV